MIYINMKDKSNKGIESVNGHYFYKGNNYGVKLKAGKVSWMDLWKTIEELVRLNGDTEDFIIDAFEVKESSKDKFYVRAIINFKVADACEEDDDDDC